MFECFDMKCFYFATYLLSLYMVYYFYMIMVISYIIFVIGKELTYPQRDLIFIYRQRVTTYSYRFQYVCRHVQYNYVITYFNNFVIFFLVYNCYYC